MAYYIRDDRMTPREAAIRNRGRSEQYRITNVSPGLSRAGNTFIHAAPTVMHDACVHACIPGVERHGDHSHESLKASFDARDKWAAQFGPGHALCWAPVYSVKPDAPACYFCSEPVVGRG